jgi:BlaI family transcriptional regulator, penicillinase repressor
MTFPEAASLWPESIFPRGEESFRMPSIPPKGSGAPKRLSVPTAAEFRLLEILWRLGEGTIEDLLQASGKDSVLNYKTVQTVLRIMETKKFVGHSVRGRAFVYQPRVKHHEIRRISLRSLLEKYFRGSRSELLVNLLEDERIDAGELQELEKLVRTHRKARMFVRKNHS